MKIPRLLMDMGKYPSAHSRPLVPPLGPLRIGEYTSFWGKNDFTGHCTRPLVLISKP